MRERLSIAFLPAGSSPQATLLITARALRGFADGIVSVLLASYLSDLGFSPTEIGVLITGTLLGSSALTLVAGLYGGALGPKRVLLGASALMFLTGLGFTGVTEFWPLLAIAVIGTLNPSGGDVSVFVPTEQAVLPSLAPDRARTALFARYNLAGTFAAALGALASGVPIAIARSREWDLLAAERAGFVAYMVVSLLIALLYSRLETSHNAPSHRPSSALGTSRAFVLKLSTVFAIDSFGGGFVVQSLVALWLYQRFDMSVELAGTIFFVAGLLSATSQLAASWLAARIGLIPTMVYTHLPANALLILTALMPTAPLAIACLLARMALSQMDVPARQSYVMAMVPPEERAAAASVTNVPRSLASGLAPALGGYLLSLTTFGWPLVLGGAIKGAYDIILLSMFKRHRPVEERHMERVGVNS
jgi:predicted MFS family arabinose efflux permease